MTQSIKKARKRLQNRESAIRSRQKKKENSRNLENEIDYLKKENYRLAHENKSLHNEKSFLIDQIKFMQNLIRSNNIINKKEEKESNDIEKNINVSKPNIVLNGASQKSFGKLFSVFIVCVLSIAYFANGDETDETISFNSGSTLSLNDASEREKITTHVGYFSRLLTVFVVGLATWFIYSGIEKVLSHLKMRAEKLNKLK